MTVEVSGTAPAAGAEEVVLFTGIAHRTGTTDHRRPGCVPVTDFTAPDSAVGGGFFG
ncbi:hypothetical protein ACFYXS_16850 [Streptomyces sp. NPDC002574]|uniref:hypothetical protein n=1 Tax=Streptomyces sp. NPDC002574 TaxID=3364652 RepID=UPI0036AB6C60